MRKNSVASSALRCMASNNLQRMVRKRELLSGTMDTLPTKNEVSNHVELKALGAAPLEHSRHVRVLHEAVIDDHGMEIVAKVDDLEALVGRDARNVAGDDVQQHDALVQHLVVLEIVQQRNRHHIDPAGQIDGGAR